MDRIKAHGIHYTPPELADFLASVVAKHLPLGEPLQILDPACGDGSLLEALITALADQQLANFNITGFDTDPAAVEISRQRLDRLSVGCTLEQKDFLDTISNPALSKDRLGYDIIIANPPYVRTQVLGEQRSRSLAKRFGLSGRVDLYQVFVKAMAEVLKPGGVLGLLTSNRFLTVKAGESLRRLLRTDFEVREIYDLGDTKLFSAAVLPVIVVAVKNTPMVAGESSSEFHRVYAAANAGWQSRLFPKLLDVLQDEAFDGCVETAEGTFQIERGLLKPAEDPGEVWALNKPEYETWLNTIASNCCCELGDVADVRVGIKTTADAVFVRNDWETLPTEIQPEPELLYPLFTHREARRWAVDSPATFPRVLYPHQTGQNGKREPIDLERFPRAAAYLLHHQDRLKARKYLIDSHRQWFEIWVPHSPADWDKPKVVGPDISVEPRFFLDQTGAIVQGDCYWITLKGDLPEDWLFLILAVINSRLISRFYDLKFHNKLYAGRRRFMTQYVKQFPLPALDAKFSRELVGLSRRLIASPETEALEKKADALVWRAFGLDQSHDPIHS